MEYICHRPTGNSISCTKHSPILWMFSNSSIYTTPAHHCSIPKSVFSVSNSKIRQINFTNAYRIWMWIGPKYLWPITKAYC